MADLKISALNSLAGADLVAADVVAVVDDSASETKKLTVSDLIANGVTLISNSTIPSAKILFAAGSVATASVADAGITTAKVADDAITAAKLANNSSVTLVSTLPGSGDFTGQVALDTDDSKIYVWSGSAWTSVKGAGSINVVNGSTTGEINIVASTSGDTVTISATLDNTTAAAQFLGGPTGAAGAVGYRALVGTDLPTPTTSTKGGVIVNGEGLRMDSDTIEIDNDLTANTSSFQVVKFSSKGLITSGQNIAAGDLPNATSGAVGAVKPGSGLSMGSAGAINHTNAVTGATNTKITFDAQGHVTAGANLAASDVPDLDTAKITTGTFPTARIADEGITADKLADRSTATIAESTPSGGNYIGQLHLNSLSSDLFLWDGNVWQPIGISVGEIVLAGTYNASTNKMATVTSEGTALSFVVGSALPAASTANKGYYVVVSTAGTGTSPAPTVALNPPDFLLSTGAEYTEIDVSNTVTAQQASNVAFTAAGNISATNVQAALEELDTEKVGAASPTFTGTVALGEDAVMTFEGATSNDFETTLTVTDPTADRTITLPNVTGTVVTTGDTGSVTSAMIADGAIVNADINASAEIAVSKLANGSARQLLQTASNGTDVEFTSNVDVPGTLDCTGAGTFDSTLTVTGVINADGKVKFPAGTAAAPSFYSGTDTNTGLYFSAADEVSVATGGTQRVVVDSAGRVALGTSTPSNFSTSTNNFVVSETGGNSGITLHTGTSNSSFLGFTDTGDTNNQGYIGYSHSDNALLFASNSAERFRIDSSGHLLLGTTAGGAKLVVGAVSSSSTNRGGVAIKAAQDHHNLPTNIYLEEESGSEGYQLSISADGGLNFHNSGAATPTVTFSDDDKVGIGTSSPGSKLDVLGGSDASVIVTVNGADNSSEYLGLGINAGAAVITAGGNGSTSNALVFKTAPSGTETEQMRIDSSGKLLVGTSSTVDSSSTALLQASASGGALFALGNPNTVGAGAATLGQVGFYGYQGAYALGASITANSGATWSSNDYPTRLTFSTTADGASSPTERMRIAPNGVVTVKNGAVAEIDTLTSASTVTPDFAASCNFTLTLGTDVSLANPTNLTPGQSGSIFLVQDGTGSRTLTFSGTYWDFAGGTAPTLSTAANAVDRLDYIVRTSTSIHCVVTLAYS